MKILTNTTSKPTDADQRPVNDPKSETIKLINALGRSIDDPKYKQAYDQSAMAARKFVSDNFKEKTPIPEISLYGGYVQLEWKLKKEIKIRFWEDKTAYFYFNDMDFCSFTFNDVPLDDDKLKTLVWEVTDNLVTD